jgi:hypothetical protein
MAVKTGNLIRGLVQPFGTMVASGWKGEQVLKARAGSKYKSTSSRVDLAKSWIAIYASYWYNFLVDVQRQEWNQYASMLNSASKEESNRVVSGSGDIIPHRNKLMSGFNAFLGCCGLNISCGHPSGIGPNAPLDIPPPEAPYLSSAYWEYSTGRLTVNWYDPDYLNPPFYEHVTVYVRLWCDVQRKGAFHPFMVVAYPCPTGGTCYFTGVQGSHSFGSPVIELKKLVGAMVRLQMDAVAIYDDGTTVKGGVVGFPSEVKEVLITTG